MKHFGILLPFALAAGISLAAYAQEPPRRFPTHDVAAVQTRSKGTIREAAGRAYARALQEAEEDKGVADLQRLTTLPATDDDGISAVLGVAEFRNGSVGVFFGQKDAKEPDRWIVFRKDDLPVLRDAVERCRLAASQ